MWVFQGTRLLIKYFILISILFSIIENNIFFLNFQSQAMHVVRTIGQAFEVCHKINQERTDDDKTKKTGDPGAITPVETPIDADEKSELATSLCIA